ncbi:ovochymase-1 isoform X1 [Anguilla anguilla]|uniref:ovochymase-1 isoform X1 n=1 Tax=Anguilla anguilla TaxID=7936 RepID=UPI0015B0CADF|nr:ovochymase-1 isoform X1 [Anguilla anguilla]
MFAVFIAIYGLLWQWIHPAVADSISASQQKSAQPQGSSVNGSVEILSCESIRASYEALAEQNPDDSAAGAGNVSCESIRAVYEGLAGKRASLLDETGRTRILGGREAQAHSWPWQVTLKVITMPACGGAVLTPSWVISARHCFLSYSNIRLWKVMAGKHDLQNEEEACQQISKISKIIPHEDYNRSKKTNDVVLVKLETPLRFTDCVRPITIVTEPVEPPGMCTVTGWGSTTEYGPRMAKLQEVNVTILSHGTCSRLYGPRVTETMLCAGDVEGGVDACQGDSGGPLSCYSGDRYKLAGIVSWGVGCGRAGKPGVYTNLQHYARWVESTIKAEASPGPDESSDRMADVCGLAAVPPWGLSADCARVRRVEGEARVEPVSEASAHSWPWQVSLQAEGRHCCSGSLVRRRWVLASSHCHCRAGGKVDSVLLGAHRLWLSTSQAFGIQAVNTSHANQTGAPPSSDLMLIRIQGAVEFGLTIAPVCLPDQGSKLDESWSCVTTGWEMGTFSAFISPNVLHQARLQLLNASACESRWGEEFSDEVHLCADAAGSVGCMGNAGGPLLCSSGGVYYLFGLMTRSGSQCDASSPAVFTRVSAFRPWITQITGES